MGPLDAFWHAVNFVAPAGGVAVLAAALVKLLWQRELAGVSWWRLVAAAAAAGVAALIGGLMAFGRDGAMATYAVLVVVTALALWLAGFAGR
jgi:hypothetical protein